jgi:transmembrane sensor
VELMDGEVMFSVAKDQERPFSVLAGELEVRAVGTSFMVRNMAGLPPEVLVQEGMVDVVYRAQPTSLVRAGANTRVTGESGAAGARLIKASVSPDTVARETAWRQGMIAFEGVSLRTAAAEFSRYSDTRIVIDDAAIANTTITGLFQASNPAGFSQAVAGSLGLKVEMGPGFVRLYSE